MEEPRAPGLVGAKWRTALMTVRTSVSVVPPHSRSSRKLAHPQLQLSGWPTEGKFSAQNRAVLSAADVPASSFQ